MICDDEKDILLAFAIELQTKYNVLTADSRTMYKEIS